jgi:glycosyltransferase involved in cell wall biosynthesis
MSRHPGPLVSVLLPCFNAERFLGRALSSLLRQDYPHFEVIAIDDGSTDGTRRILDQFVETDGRLRVIENEENLGLIRTLNRGLREARGELVARMDADDMSLPARFQRQVDFLEGNPAIAVVGAGVEHIDRWDRPLRRTPPRALGSAGVKFLAIMGTPLAHPTMMARTEILQRFGYRFEADCVHVEDYDLFIRLARSGVQMANLETPLVQKRENLEGVSHSFEPQQIDRFLHLSRRFVQDELELAVEPMVHRVVVNRLDSAVRPTDLREGVLMIERIRDTFLADGGFELDDPGAREVASVAKQQQVDVLIQALKKGSAGVRGTALVLGPHLLPGLFSGPVRGHLLAKFRLSC